MAPPRATRTRKVVVDSDEEIPNAQPTSIPTRSRPSRARPSNNAKSNLDPAERTRESSAASTPPKKTKTLYSFFNAATTQQQQQQQQQHEQRAQNPSRPSSQAIQELDPIDEIDDTFLDDISEDDEYGGRAYRVPASAAGPAKAPAQKTTSSKRSADDTLRASKFVKTANGSRASPQLVPPVAQERDLPWTEKYAPVRLDELAVHKRKVTDVRQWLEDVLAGRNFQRLLVLKGPAGSGKTSTVKLLAKTLRCSVAEWTSSGSGDFTSDSYVSLSAQFDEFLNRGSKYAGLDFVNASGQAIDLGRSHDEPCDEQILLIEEFPNLAARTYSTLASFRSSIIQYLAAHVRFPAGRAGAQAQGKSPPLVIVISESVMSSSASSTDSFTTHRLLGADILHHPGTRVIEFNPINNSLMTRTLNSIANRYSRESGHASLATPAIIQKLAQLGDIRNAISNFQFLQSHGKSNLVSLSRPVGRGVRSLSKKPAPPPGESEQAVIDLLSLREGNIGLFHAVGKVVHNKRNPPLPSQPAAAKGLSEVDVESLQSTTGTDISTFLSAIHENYMPSCTAANLEASLDCVNDCLDYLGDADIMAPVGQSGGYSAGEGLRQEELAFYVGVAGTLDALPYPVKRESLSAPGTVSEARRRMEGFKIFYPTEIKLWSRRQEMKSMLEFFSKPSLFARRELSSLLPARRQSGFSLSADFHPSESANGALSALLVRQELLLEKLPYLAKMVRRSPMPSSVVDDLFKLTTFRGHGAVNNDEDDDDPVGAVAGGNVYGNQQRSRGLAKDLAVDKLVLSDDDIEDD